MINVAVVDTSAAARNALVERVYTLVRSGVSTTGLIPRISVRPLSPEEVQFHAAPDVCIIGEEIIERSLPELAQLKRLLPQTAFIAFTNTALNDLYMVEQLGRMGADDVISRETTPTEFMRKIVLLSRRLTKPSRGKLMLVDGGKGGVGVTSITAGLAEALVCHGQSIAVIDCDFETQDLSRFLQVRPFINENLRLLLDEQRPISEETVHECLIPVWDDESKFWCMPPVEETEDLYRLQANQLQHWLAVLEILDSTVDCTLVDIGCARGLLKKALYQVADQLVFVVNGDPAGFYASLDRLSQARSELSAGAGLIVVENTCGCGGLSNNSLRREFTRMAHLSEESWAPRAVPFCRSANRWPGSGATLYSQGRVGVRTSIELVLASLGMVERAERRHLIQLNATDLTRRMLSMVRAFMPAGRPESRTEQESVRSLPGVTADQEVSKDKAVPRLLDSPGAKSEVSGEELQRIPIEELVSGAKAA